MRDGAFPFRRARSFLNVSSGRAFLFCRRHNDNATTVMDRRYRVSVGAAAVRGCERLSSLRGNDLPRSVVLQLCALDAITHDVMRRDAVRVSMPVFAHAIVSAKDVCGYALFLSRVLLVVLVCARLALAVADRHRNDALLRSDRAGRRAASRRHGRSGQGASARRGCAALRQ